MYKLRCDYRHVNYIGIVLVYYLNGMPFIYDDISEEERNDPYVKAMAGSEDAIDVEQLTKNSEYLMVEELHPLLSELFLISWGCEDLINDYN